MQRHSFDSAYLSRLARGDRPTETHFLAYFGELLTIKLRGSLRSSQEIEDVRQETFLRVFRALRTRGVASPEKLGAFVNGVCNNVLSEHYRAVSRTLPMPEEPKESASELPNPEQQMHSSERMRTVHRVLNALPAKDREILRLIFFQELEKDEVCRRCSVSRSYLRVLLHRAKIRFKERAIGNASEVPITVYVQTA